MSKFPDPAEILKQRQIKDIAEAKKCVALLLALDFINNHPEHAEYKQKLEPYMTYIKRARDARNKIRERCDREKREWLKGPEEYDAIEQHLIESLKPTMPQSEYQTLDRAYQEQKNWIASIAGISFPSSYSGVVFFRSLRETRIKSPVRPELVEGLAVPIDCYRFNPIMVRQAHHERIKSAFP